MAYCHQQARFYQVHPRIRGEYFYRIICMRMRIGSPPHPRGILRIRKLDGVVPRFTPASAGNIAIASHRKWGETGSPPHPRGIWYSCSRPRSPARFTPASAGNIAKRELDSSSRRVHPRIRGEYPLLDALPDPPLGSPPHPRGI